MKILYSKALCSSNLCTKNIGLGKSVKVRLFADLISQCVLSDFRQSNAVLLCVVGLYVFELPASLSPATIFNKDIRVDDDDGERSGFFHDYSSMQ